VCVCVWVGVCQITYSVNVTSDASKWCHNAITRHRVPQQLLTAKQAYNGCVQFC